MVDNDAHWPAEQPTLVGRLVVLRPFRSDDVDAMASVLVDPRVARLTGSVASTAATHGGYERSILEEWYSTRATQRDRLDLAIVDRANDTVVGEVVLNDRDAANQSCNFRTLVGPTGRNRGLGTEAARLVVDHGIRILGLHRIELEVYDFNPRARHVYERVGFRYEGTRRQCLRFDDEWIDAHIMAVLADDWLANPATARSS